MWYLVAKQVHKAKNPCFFIMEIYYEEFTLFTMCLGPLAHSNQYILISPYFHYHDQIVIPKSGNFLLCVTNKHSGVMEVLLI